MQNKEKVGVVDMNIVALFALLLLLLLVAEVDEEFVLFSAKEVAEETVSATDNNCP
jgi:hypothetical protein